MQERFVVPQFIDVEARILGPVTVRQFIIMLVPLLFGVLFFKLFNFFTFLAITVPLTIVCGALAFFRVNGMPAHYFILNLLQSMRRPRLRVWDKVFSDEEVKSHMAHEEAPPVPLPPRKTPFTTSRLQELSLIVNTGGVYKPDEEI